MLTATKRELDNSIEQNGHLNIPKYRLARHVTYTLGLCLLFTKKSFPQRNYPSFGST